MLIEKFLYSALLFVVCWVAYDFCLFLNLTLYVVFILLLILFTCYLVFWYFLNEGIARILVVDNRVKCFVFFGELVYYQINIDIYLFVNK